MTLFHRVAETTDTYNGVAILSNSDQITAQANTSLSSWIVDIGGRASDGSTYPVATRDAFGVRRVAPGGAYLSAANYLQIDAGETVFNEDSNDQDFRVESNGNTHMLFVDAGADHVNIGTSSDLNGVLGVNGLVVSDGVSNGFRVVRGSGAYYGQLYVNYEDSKVNTYIDSIASTSFIGQIIARTSDSSSTATEQFKLSNGVGAIFNETGADLDFRVESDGNTNMLFVDGGNNKVNVGGSTPYGGALNVNGAKNVTAYASDNQIAVTDTTALAAGVGGAINFNGVYTTSGDVTSAAVIEASKINATTAHWGFGLNLRTRTHGANSDSRLYLDQNNTVFNETGADTDFRVESEQQR